MPAASGLAAGVLLGLLYFGGLWVTLKRIEGARRPAVLLVGSYLVRLTVAGAGFGALVLWGIGPAAAGLVGFLLARTALVRRLSPGSHRGRWAGEGG